jgi:hypothetical protein
MFMAEHKRARQGEKKERLLPKREGRRIHLPIRHLIAVGLIAGLALVIYSNTFQVPFHFDDSPNIVQNPTIQIKVLTWDRLGQLVRNTYKESIRVFSYLTLALNYYIGGLDVFGYHVVNLGIHVAAGIFLYWFLLLTFNLPSLRERYGPIAYRVALFTSLIFIAHPIQTQSVTYIVQRMASMAGMFYLLTLVLYVKGRQGHGIGRAACFGGMVLTYLLGVFSKENVAILPFFVALYEFYFFQRFDLSPKGKKVVVGLALMLLVLGVLGVAVWGKRYLQVIIEGYPYRTFSMSERVLTQARIVLYYLSLLIYPHPSRLNLDYDFPISSTILDPPTTLLSLVVIAGLIGYAVWAAKKRPVLSFSILWYFGNLVIESSIFPLELVYEHRLYLPAIGLFLPFTLLVVKGGEWLKARGDSALARPPLESGGGSGAGGR